jgi:putative nucleotidyltransferase with HDIG domain
MKLVNLRNPLFIIFLPLALYTFLRLNPSVDPLIDIPVQHFYAVSATSLIATIIGIAIGISGSRQRNLQVVYVALAFISLASIFGVHGLATPDVLMPFTRLVGVAAQLSVFVMAFWLWLSSLPSNNRISSWLGNHVNLLLILWTVPLLTIAGISLKNPSIADFIPVDQNPLRWFVASLTVLLSLVASYRFWQSYRYSKFPLQLTLAYSAGWIAVSQIIISTGVVYFLSWWIYHLLLFLAVFVPILGLLAQYSRGDSLVDSMRGLFSLDPFERLEAGISPSIKALIAATEARDPYTAGHSERVALGAIKLARALGLPPEDLRVLAQGGLVHDIGKLQVPDIILNKPGKLSKAERLIIQEHAINGYELCTRLGFMKPELEVVRSHHERIDGKGYPDGLSNEDIPTLVRILSVVDVFDALTTERSYRSAWTQEKAFDYLRENRGRQFDSDFVDVWIDTVKGDPSDK